ncbi:MAG: sugar transferase [bacterium]|nr:sugar transferase [bacterium]
MTKRQIILPLLHALRVVIDFGVVYVSFYFGYQIYFLDKPRIWAVYNPELSPKLYFIPSPEYHYLTIAMGLGVLVVLVYAFMRLYEDDTSILHVKEYRRVVIGFIVAVVIFLAGYYWWIAYVPGTRKLFSRRIFAYACTLSVLGIMMGRALFNQIQYALHRRGIGARRVLIYGAGGVGRAVAKRLAEFPAFGLSPVGFIDDEPARTNTQVTYDPARRRSLPVLGTGEQLQRHVIQQQADEVLIALPNATADQMFRIVNDCLAGGIRFQFVPNVFELAFQRTITRDLVGIPVIGLRETSRRVVYLALKRLMDVVLSALALIIMAPFIGVIALAIRLDSKGPVFFVHTRIGMNGVPFRMYKFRTMYAHVGKYERTPLESTDPRITRLGRWLRRTSLDELPQLVNVLKGDMSLVGPRPEMPFIVEQYNDLHRERLKVKPGITGLWQLSADRRLAIHENIDYDLYYIHEQSLLLDIVILVQTIFLAFRGI